LIVASAAKINDMLKNYDRIDKLPESTPPNSKYPTPFGSPPTPETNPYNAW